MLNLTGQIQNFKEKISDNKLFQYIPLHQTMKQQNITISQLANENTFILQALKTSHSIFLNYCWLNDRVYGKIIEHELNLHQENVKFHSINNNFERKMEESLQMYKVLYEESSSQNKRHKDIIQSGLTKLNQQIQSKVSKKQLPEIVKKMIYEYDQTYIDQDSFDIRQSNTGIFSLSQHLQFNITNNHKIIKTGKVHHRDFYRLKDQIYEIFQKIHKQYKQLTFDYNISKQKISQHYQMLQYNSDEIKYTKNNLNKLNNQYGFNIKLVREELQRIVLKIQQNFSDSQWRKRFQAYQMKTLEPLRGIIFQHIHNVKNDVKKIKQDTYLKTNIANNNVAQLTSEIAQYKLKMVRTIQEAQILKNRFEDMQQVVGQDMKQSNLRLDTFFNDYKKFGYQFQKNIKRQTAQLRNMIVKLSANVEQKALKSIYKKIQTDLGKFQHDLMDSKDQISSLTHLNTLSNQQIQNLKETIVRKANITDFMKVLDNKADKDDIKQLKETINQQNQSINSLNNTNINISNHIIDNNTIDINSDTKNSTSNNHIRSSAFKDQQQVYNKSQFFKNLEFSTKRSKTQFIPYESQKIEITKNKLQESRKNQQASLKKVQNYLKTQRFEKKSQKSLSIYNQKLKTQRQTKGFDSFRKQRKQRSSQKSIKRFQTFQISEFEQTKYQTVQDELINKTNHIDFDIKNKSSRQLLIRNPKRDLLKFNKNT